MAPSKGTLPQRMIAQDWLGFNWAKITWRTPYNNFYPITLSGGWAGRQWSNPISFGHFANRATYHWARTAALMLPSAYLALLVFLMADWYDVYKLNYGTIKIFYPIEIPESVQKKHAEDQLWNSRYKPGQIAKHHYAGAVSIPGSEAFVQEM